MTSKEKVDLLEKCSQELVTINKEYQYCFEVLTHTMRIAVDQGRTVELTLLQRELSVTAEQLSYVRTKLEHSYVDLLISLLDDLDKATLDKLGNLSDPAKKDNVH